MRPRWNIKDACHFISKVKIIADKHRYNVSLYGSVVTNCEGKDLDLAFFPKALHYRRNFMSLFYEIKNELDLDCVSNWHLSQFSGTYSKVLEDIDGRLIDLVFHYVDLTQADEENQPIQPKEPELGS